jgi:hypothetical protein
MSQDDVLFGYRLQLFDLAGRIAFRPPVVAPIKDLGRGRACQRARRPRASVRGDLELLAPVISPFDTNPPPRPAD